MSTDSTIRRNAKRYGYLFWKHRGQPYRLYDPLSDQYWSADDPEKLEPILPITNTPHNQIMAEARRQRLASRIEEWRAKKKADDAA
jgi:hypothetical protein